MVIEISDQRDDEHREDSAEERERLRTLLKGMTRKGCERRPT